MTTNSNDTKNEKTVVYIDPDLSDLIPGFLENRKKDVKLIFEALNKEDFESIRILGHSMKGVGGGYGFDDITDIGASLEQAAKKCNKQDVQMLLHKLQSYLEEVQVIYE
ncbi:MAG: Hpt domain-containing protein [Peptococcaceae bacterium]|nr:Hpt domain-containing protein [Peptococcaceae bacterium]